MVVSKMFSIVSNCFDRIKPKWLCASATPREQS